MAWLIVAAHFALATVLASFAARHGMSPLAALWYIAIPGFMSSLMSALPEALAAAGIVAGFLFWESRRPVLAAAAFGAALLVRETGVVLLGVLALQSASRVEWRRSALVLAGALAPVCAWRLFVASRLFQEFKWEALVTNPGDLGVPFGGLVHLWTAGLQRAQPSSEVAGALVYPVLLAGALGVAASLWVARKGPLETAGLIYAVIGVSLNYEKIWSHLPSGERGTFELFVCLLLLFLGSAGRPAWIRRTLTVFFVVLLGYTFFIAPDASTSRAALLLIR
jgi:hypothetical protein